MNNLEIKQYPFDINNIDILGTENREINWPVVYQIFDDSSIYIGESTNLKSRMKQHIQNPEKESLNHFSVVYDKRYNKSVALDLESQLIQWFSGEGNYTMLNKNDGLVDRDYYQRSNYREQFVAVWNELKKLKIATHSIKSIENSGLFKFSPYKRLNIDQLNVVYQILSEIINDFKSDTGEMHIIGGDEGTGKTIVLMYLVKLIRDVQEFEERINDEKEDGLFSDFFSAEKRNIIKNKSIAVVIPNQSLRGSMSKIFRTISNLNKVDILSPIQFGSSSKNYDITFVDEGHLLKIGNQEVHKRNRDKVDEINRKLFGETDKHNELDWILEKSNTVVIVYGDQRVRQNNITSSDLKKYRNKEYLLKSQIRSNGGVLYIEYLKRLLSDDPPNNKQTFPDFEFKIYMDINKFIKDVRSREEEVGLSRLVAGFAWDWKSKLNRNEFDIVIDDVKLRWNSTVDDFIGSRNSIDEVGSIYTIQGNDLNYCGVIIGNDLRYDTKLQKIVIDRKSYKDRGAKKRNRIQLENKSTLTDEELLEQIKRTYRILMNRSIRGTYVYVCDVNLRNYLSKYLEIVQ